MTYLWKEWKELSRGSGLWFSVGIVALISFLILMQSRAYPAEQGFELFLLSLYEMNVYVIPLLAMLVASFSLLQEREQKTMIMLLTKKESFRSFLLHKTVGVQTLLAALFIGWYILFAALAKLFLPFQAAHFLAFLLAIEVMLFIFAQIGLFLGSICATRMQLVGAAIFCWFLFLFLIDLAFLYYLPAVTYENMKLFSILYFLDPLHALQMYLETALQLVSAAHLSRLMQKLVWLPPATFMLLNLLLWSIATFELAVRLAKKGERV